MSDRKQAKNRNQSRCCSPEWTGECNKSHQGSKGQWWRTMDEGAEWNTARGPSPDNKVLYQLGAICTRDMPTFNLIGENEMQVQERRRHTKWERWQGLTDKKHSERQGNTGTKKKKKLITYDSKPKQLSRHTHQATGCMTDKVWFDSRKRQKASLFSSCLWGLPSRSSGYRE
jgi:hypothetical protein